MSAWVVGSAAAKRDWRREAIAGGSDVLFAGGSNVLLVLSAMVKGGEGGVVNK